MKACQHQGSLLTLLHRPSRLLALSIALAYAGSHVAPLWAGSLPQGGQVISGQANISQQGNGLRVDTKTDRTAINWQKFSIGPDHKVHFQQPDGSSVTLNRVIGGDPSKIYGMLSSNGKLILLNPNGIWFGPDSRISSRALVAAAGRISDEQMAAFEKSGKLDVQLEGLVRNEGRIEVPDHGSVVLLGAQVENAGVIQARQGEVTLATGPRATLDFHGDGLLSLALLDGADNQVSEGLSGGVSNSGTIDVGSGVVAMSAARAAKHLDSVISVGGAVIANSVSSQGGRIVLGNSARTEVSGSLSAKGTDGGSIKVLGDQVQIAGSARLDASGSAGKGGEILVGGGFQGQGEVSAKSASVAKGAQLRADGKKYGGLIVTWSDGTTTFAGQASAKGGERGGVVETSGKRLHVSADAKVDASGGNTSGTWLLDPETVNIVDNASGDDVSAASLVNSLKTTNVVVSASQRINVNAPIIASQIGLVMVDGQPTGATLALIANGNPGQVSSYDGSDKHNDSGSVHINAPILLKDGNLFIAATGDVRLVDNAQSGDQGDAAWSKRAIIDVGSGIVWIKTSNTASVTQDANTALIGGQVAVQGASVKLNSVLNHAGVLAGKASNGVFQFNQTNASGTTTTGTVKAPFSGESLSGVSAEQIKYLGSQEVIADNAHNGFTNPYQSVTLSAGGQQFDYLVFEAGGFVDGNGKAINPAELFNYLDSSDYLLHGLSFTDAAGVTWAFSPDSTAAGMTSVTRNGQPYASLPVGFSLGADKGTVVAVDLDVRPYGGMLFDNAGWGVAGYNIPGPTNAAEIQHNSQDGTSERLTVGLGGTTDSVQAQLGWLLNDQAWAQPKDGKNPSHPLLERARVHFLATQDAGADAVQLGAQKASVNLEVEGANRVYGDANPQLQAQQKENAAASQVRELDRFVDQQLGRSGIAQGSLETDATERSNIGQYAISGSLAGDDFANRRYEIGVSNGTLTITPAPLDVIAHDKAKQVGEQDPALSHEATGWKFADDERDFSLDRAKGEAPGQYRIFEKDGTRLVSANYEVTFHDGKLSISGPVNPDPGPDPKPGPDPQPTPAPQPGPDPHVGSVSVAQGPSGERCTALESPSAVSANYSVTPAVVRTYQVQLVCKPRSYGSPEEQLPDASDILTYANGLLKDGKFLLPDWNRTVIPRELQLDAPQGK